jgi:hypothetical protein
MCTARNKRKVGMETTEQKDRITGRRFLELSTTRTAGEGKSRAAWRSSAASVIGSSRSRAVSSRMGWRCAAPT